MSNTPSVEDLVMHAERLAEYTDEKGEPTLYKTPLREMAARSYSLSKCFLFWRIHQTDSQVEDGHVEVTSPVRPAEQLKDRTGKNAVLKIRVDLDTKRVNQDSRKCRFKLGSGYYDNLRRIWGTRYLTVGLRLSLACRRAWTGARLQTYWSLCWSFDMIVQFVNRVPVQGTASMIGQDIATNVRYLLRYVDKPAIVHDKLQRGIMQMAHAGGLFKLQAL
ncbi:hypothetical protein DFH29DRAFT_1070849, partial [Suillus ampliporus]